MLCLNKAVCTIKPCFDDPVRQVDTQVCAKFWANAVADCAQSVLKVMGNWSASMCAKFVREIRNDQKIVGVARDSAHLPCRCPLYWPVPSAVGNLPRMRVLDEFRHLIDLQWSPTSSVMQSANLLHS